LREAERLRRRLKAMKRFRKEVLTAKAVRLENQILELVTAGTAWASPSTPHPSVEVAELNSISSEEHQRLVKLLEHARREYDELIDFMQSEQAAPVNATAAARNANTPSPIVAIAAKSLVPAHPKLPRPLPVDVNLLHRQIEYLEGELERAFAVDDDKQAEERNLRDQIEVLRTQLLESRHETIELRIQNADLCERHQKKQTELSWEQRKEQLLIELEGEVSKNPALRSEAERIRVVIETSQREISGLQEQVAARDREIDELKMLLNEQSSVTENLAVGAQAIAGLLDADEFIREERDKLRTMQLEWEEKLRTAEIEISMERARLARERLEFEYLKTQVVDVSDAEGEANDMTGKTDSPRPRRWLSRLGLREE
jgi:hypothetical protein